MMQTKIYTAQQISNLLELNATRLVAGLIDEEEFTSEKRRIIGLPRASVTNYEVHDEAECGFCQEKEAERAKMDNSVLAGSSQTSQKINGIRI